ncbi:MAG: hypothetical protein LUE92_10580, partial [Clostridiales bacterium]|nr:hypothetical protein [Clostridiales bacterium]
SKQEYHKRPPFASFRLKVLEKSFPLPPACILGLRGPGDTLCGVGDRAGAAEERDSEFLKSSKRRLSRLLLACAGCVRRQPEKFLTQPCA